MASSAPRHLFLVAFVAALALVAAPRASAWGGGRLFFSKTTRPQEAVVEPGKAATGAAPDAAADPNGAATVFSRPSTGGGGRGYGLYGRPEENFPPDYFRRGVRRNAEKLTTTTSVQTTSGGAAAGEVAAVPLEGRGGERAEPLAEDDGSGRGRPRTNVPIASRGSERAEPLVEYDGSGRGRQPWTNTNDVPATTSTDEETIPMGSGGGESAEPFGSDRGRAPWFHYGSNNADGRPEDRQRNYGMSDTRLYQNGRYYYDPGARRYGYGRESNHVRTRPAEEFAGDGRGRYYGDAAGRYYQYGDEFRNGFQEESQNGQSYAP